MINNIKSELINIIANSFHDKGYDIDIIEHLDLVNDMSMDSITFISLVVKIESRFDIEIPDDFLLMDYFQNIDKIVEIVVTEMSQR